jgi:hypothetical protein
VSFDFSINLARDEVNQLKLERDRLRVVTTSFFLFGLLLIGTFAIYMHRQTEVEALESEISVYATTVQKRGISPSKVKRMKERSEKLQKHMAEMQRFVTSSNSWSLILAALVRCANSEEVRLKRVSGSSDLVGALVFEGTCPASDALSRIDRFMTVVEQDDLFGRGRVVSVGRESEPERVAFKAEIALAGTDRVPTSVATARETRDGR